jgi:hypothetical protein
VIPFFVGCLISAVAATPAVLLLLAARGGDFKAKLRAWAVGMILRFAIIGAALIFLFRTHTLAQIPVVLGIVVVYFVVLAVELAVVFRAK